MEYFREIAAEALSEEYEVQSVATKDAAKTALGRGKVDLMVLDLTPKFCATDPTEDSV